jgi:hypothetical protein
VCAQLEADHAGILLIRANGRLETVAASDDVVEESDQLQDELDEGPGRDSSWHRETLLSSDVAADARWPRWAAKVADLGIASVLAVELTSVEDRRIGAINIHWTRCREFTTDDVAFANIFARHAALALAQSMNEAGLNTALDTRKLIGQAQGILMERYNLDKPERSRCYAATPKTTTSNSGIRRGPDRDPTAALTGGMTKGPAGTDPRRQILGALRRSAQAPVVHRQRHGAAFCWQGRLEELSIRPRGQPRTSRRGCLRSG